MKRLTLILATLAVAACNEAPVSIDLPNDTEGIIAQKKPWEQTTKASDAFLSAKDIPWGEGEKVLLLGSDQSVGDCTIAVENGSHGIHPFKKTLCTVTKASGLECTLTPDTRTLSFQNRSNIRRATN